MSGCAMWMILALAASCSVMSLARIMEPGHSRPPFQLPSSPSSASSTGAASALRLAKREAFDPSCKGIYNRAIWAKLNRACEDCQNLFRKEPAIYESCREKCFDTPIFPACVIELSLNLNEYMFEAELIREL
ncbi:molt-inhibiting hormone-like [Penaeus indicus]|uniref:molt-inhibiting hormone-like n=1 Tax=Penaeus indicus TaxID=29960 RepID=UPI00300CA0E0